MKSILKLSLAAALAVSALSAKESAVVPGLDVSANMAITTNYIWRGVSYSGETPTAQAGIDFAHESGVYLGTWGSGYNSGSVNGQEIDLYVGYSTEVSGLGIDVGAIYYVYTDFATKDWYTNISYPEYYLGLSYNISGVDVGLTESLAATADVAEYINSELSVGYDFEVASVSFAYGYVSSLADADPSSYVQAGLAIPCPITGGEWGLTYAMAMSSTTTSTFALSHGFSF